jgi:hypothetical protein
LRISFGTLFGPGISGYLFPWGQALSSLVRNSQQIDVFVLSARDEDKGKHAKRYFRKRIYEWYETCHDRSEGNDYLGRPISIQITYTAKLKPEKKYNKRQNGNKPSNDNETRDEIKEKLQYIEEKRQAEHECLYKERNTYLFFLASLPLHNLR